MKFKSLPLAIAMAATTAMTSSAIADDLTVYGKVNVSLNKLDYELGNEDQWELNSNAARVGVKGSVDINDNLKAIYKAEYEISVDGDGDEFTQRNIYGGFQGSWGTLIAGKHDTPTKMAQGKIDRFNDLDNADIKNIFFGENRVGNIIMYTTPKMNGFSATVAAIPGEETDGNDGLADGTSIALTYKADNFSIALANDSDIVSKDLYGDKYNSDVTRLVGEMTFGDFKVGAMAQRAEAAENGIDVEQDGYLLSGEYAFDKMALKAQYGTSDNDILGVNIDATQMAIGVDYKLNKSSKLFAYYSTIDYDTSAALIELSPENNIVGVGYEIKF